MVIRYRAWDKHVKKIRKVTEIHFDDNLIYLKANNGKGYYCSFSDIELMQSTGLKDKNGVEIFEGDIVVGQQHLTTDSSTPFEIKGLVRYSKRNTMFYLDEKSFGHDKFMNSLGSSIYQFEVIGNVFANPELLEAIE